MQEVVLLAQRIEGFDISKDENKRESRPAATEARRILHSPDYRRKNRVHLWMGEWQVSGKADGNFF